MMDEDRRTTLCERYNRESIGLRKVVQEYIKIFKSENNITEEEWDEMRRNPESGEIR